MKKPREKIKASDIPGEIGYKRWVYLIVAGFSFAIYANTIPNKYNLDDELVTTVDSSRPHLLVSKGFAAIPKIFTSPYYSDEQGYSYDYRPVVLSTFAIEYSLFGANAHVSHFINVLLYAMLCMLLLAVLQALLRNYHPLIPILTTLLFAAHPIHTEVVASIKNRDEILSLLGGIGALSFFTAYVDRNSKLSLVPASFCFLLGLLSKQTIISFIILIPVLFILLRVPGAKKIVVVSLILTAVAFPFVQITLLSHRILFAGLTLSIILAIEHIRHGTILNGIKETGQILYSAYRSFRSKIKQWDRSSKQQGREHAGKNNSVAIFYLNYSLTILFTAILGSTCVFLFASDSLFVVFPVTLFLPLAFFSPPSLKKYFIWACLIPASYITYKTNFFIIHEFLLLFFAYHAIIGRKSELIPNILLLTLYYLSGFFIFKTDNLTALGFYLVAVAFVSSPKFHWVKWLALIAVIVGSVLKIIPDEAGGIYEKTIGDQSELVLHATVLLAFFFPRKYALIVPIIILTVLALIPLEFTHIPYNAFNVKKTPPIIINVGPSSNRPMDYAETVLDPTTPPDEKLGTGLLIIGKYFKLLAVPYPLSFYYGYKVIERTGLTQPVPLLVAISCLSLLALGFFYIKRHPPVATSIFILLISIFPASNLLAPIPGMVAERLLFIPSVGFCLLLALIILSLSKNKVYDSQVITLRTKPLTLGLFLPVMLLYSVMTIARNRDWRDTLTLMRHDITRVEESAQAHNLLAIHLTKKALEKSSSRDTPLLAEAEHHFERAISIYPDFFNATYDLGRVKLMQGKTGEAERAFLKATQMDVSFSDPFLMVASLRMERKDFFGAIPYFESYLKLMPANIDALINLTYCYVQTGNLRAALIVMKRAATYFPARVEPLVNLGWIYSDLGARDSAFYYMQKAETLAPTHPDVQALRNSLSR